MAKRKPAFSHTLSRDGNKRQQHKPFRGDQLSVLQQAEPFRLATAKLPFDALECQWHIGSNRELNAKQVTTLCNLFHNNGLLRTAEENFLVVKGNRDAVDRMLRHQEAHGTPTATNNASLAFFREWSRVNPNDPLEVMAGYAYKYACPQILSFDGETLLMLQFRAAKIADIKDANCPVDCWVIPRANAGGTPLRYALYRFLVQGFRRCQGCTANPALQLNGVTARRRYFFNGVPVWKIDGSETDKPWGYQRRLHCDTGAFYWADSAGNALMDDNGAVVWDTLAYWGV